MTRSPSTFARHAAVLLLVAVAGAERAAASDVAWVASVAFHPLPPGAGVTVVPYDDSDANLQLKTRFEKALAAAGRSPEGEPRLRLVFETEVRYQGQLPRAPTLGQVKGGSEGLDAEVNVWSSSEDSLLAGRRGPAKAPGDGTRLRLTAQLRETGGGRVLWQAEALYPLVEREAEAAAEALVPALVERLGESRSRQVVPLTH